MRTFTINGTEYNAKPFDFNLMCSLEDISIGLGDLITKPHLAIRAYLAICGNMSEEKAGLELQEHLIAGNDMSEISIVLSEEMDKSDFFQALLKKMQENAAKVKNEKK